MADHQDNISEELCQCGCGQIRKNPNWKGGKSLHSSKFHHYRTVRHGHPRANQSSQVLDHILVAEKALGKLLPPGVEVHHHTPTQLVVCQDRAYHQLLHQRTRALKASDMQTGENAQYVRIGIHQII